MIRECVVVVTTTREYRIRAVDDNVSGRIAEVVLGDMIRKLEGDIVPTTLNSLSTGFSEVEALGPSRTSVVVKP